MTEDANYKTRKPRNWMRLALIVSLIVNLLFVGLVVGAAAGKNRYDKRDTGVDPRILQTLGPYGRALPREKRAELAKGLRLSPAESRQMRRDLRAGFEAILAGLRAESFDAEAMMDLLGQQQGLIDARINAGRAALVEEMKAMSLAERRAYADDLQRVLRRGPGREKRPE